MNGFTGLSCPLCGSWYSNDPTMINLGYQVGEVCNNQAMTGPNPELCSPKHPCPGRLQIHIPKKRKPKPEFVYEPDPEDFIRE